MIESLIEKVPEIQEKIGYKPYVVSGDLQLILQKWADAKGFVLPGQELFDQLRGEFNAYMQKVFPAYEFVQETELKNGIIKLVNRKPIPTITLDSVYFRPEYAATLDVTRYVDNMLKNKGLGRRPGSPSLLRQFNELRGKNIQEAQIVDDVIFSGEQTERIIRILRKFGINITSVCAGIAIQEGIDRLTNLGVSVASVKRYSDVIDEVCERDFYPGVPYCGRTQDFKLNLGVPYILPFGRPSAWASIPEETQEEFSQFCMKQTAKLFESIEDASGTRIRMADIERKFGYVRQQPFMPFTEALGQMIRNNSDFFFTNP